QALESFQAKGDTTSGSDVTSPIQPVGTTGRPAGATATLAAAAPATGTAATSPTGAREALRFLFGKDGEFFREFLLDEASFCGQLLASCGVVKGADCLGRDAARELALTVGLRGSSVPSLLKAVTPKLSTEERKVVDNTNKLLAFLLGNLQV
ncbi:unnamed protein product, partial [Hapterophycus canaliculatus]